MAVIRRQRNQQSLESTQSLGLVEQVLVEVKDLTVKVDTLVRDQEHLRVNLLGGVGSDTEHGRLPKVEAELRHIREDVIIALASRVAVLEANQIRWKAYAATAAAIGGFMGGALGLAVQVLIPFVTGKP